MKKIPLLLLFILCAYVADAQIGGQVAIDTTLFSIQEEEAYHRISFGESSVTDEIGKPELPVRYETYVLPFAAEVSGLQVSTMARRQIPGTYRIYPVQPPRTTDENADTVAFVEPDPQVYGSAQPWPGKNAEIISDRYEQGYHLVTIKIYPVEYIPLTGELYVQDVIYNVNYTIGNGQNAIQAAKQSARRAELAKRAIKAIVKNPGAVDAFANPATAVVKRSTLIDPADTLATKKTRASFKPSVFEELVPDYIIITNEALKPTFRRLADWKTKKGVPAIIKTIEEIEPAYPGCDTQEKIRNYLKDAYTRWGAGLFVLLGGDVNIVPARMHKGTSDVLFYPTDMYYSALDGTWNANKNSIFGERTSYSNVDSVDIGRDLYIGRAPVENSREADVFIDKVLSYEKAQGITNTAYFNNSMAADAYLSKGETTGKLSYIVSDSIKRIYRDYTPSRVTPYFLFDNVACTEGNWDNKGCGTGNQELTRNNFLSALNNGGNAPNAPFHIIYHQDHSAEGGLGTSSLYKGQDIRREDADALSNGKYYHILVSGGCKPANFSKDCIAERFLNNPNGGAVAFIGNTDVGKFPEWIQLRGFLDALYNTQNHPSDRRYDLGNAFYRAMITGLSLYNDGLDNWRLHLLGDPEMPVWTDVPKNLQLSFVGELSDRLVVNLSGLSSGDEALICIMKGDELYSVETVTSNGEHSFYIDASETPGDITVTATAHNYIPAESSYFKDTFDELSIHIADIAINDTNSGTTWGNGDGQIDAGEMVELTISLKNTGETTATGVVGTLAKDLGNTRAVMIADNQSPFGSIAPGETKVSQLKYRIYIDKDIEEVLKDDLNPARFILTVASNEKTSFLRFNIDIFAPELRQANKVILATSYNGDQVVEAGETVIFQPYIFNAGKAQARGLTANITVAPTSSSYVTASTASVNMPDIGENETKTLMGTFNVTVSDTYTVGTPVNLILHVTDRYGKTWDFPFNLIERPAPVNVSNFAFTSGETEIELKWTADRTVGGYDIYRAPGTADSSVISNFKKINTYPLPAAFFRDKGLDKSTRYYYRIKAVTESGNEGAFTPALTAWTSYPAKGLFPVKWKKERE
ncbi:MAG: C25 family cysteine peptidase [Bacteroidales bacterium]|nr:C25 family cysteine peptidase [Bacteroidales bacterium]